MWSEFGSAMGLGAVLGLALAVVALVGAVTGTHIALGLEGLVTYLMSAPILAFDGLRGLSDPVRWIVLVVWFTALGAAFGYCLRGGGQGWFAAAVLGLAVTAGHAL